MGSANLLNERQVLTIKFGAVNGGKVSGPCHIGRRLSLTWHFSG
jgi:hypothetical protein